MKRDLDLVREILLFFEGRQSDSMITPDQIINEDTIPISAYSGKAISNHVDIMYEADLLEGYADRTDDGRLIQIYPTRLTWQGHEFLDAARNESLWNKFRDSLKAKGQSVPLEVAQKLLFKYIEGEFSS